MPPEELHFEVFGKHFAARRWGRGRPIRVLALHGWRDNCASFDFLAPLLADCDLVAPDLAGHGHSDWRSADAPYTVWQDVGELLAIVDELGWERFCLLGHSRGAAIATLLAGSHPARVERLVLLDNLFPAPVLAADAPAQLAAAIADRRALAGWKPRYHPGFDDALAARTRGPLALPLDAARALALRGVEKSPEGYYWRGDPRLGAASEVKFSEEHALAFVKALTFPVLLLLGADSPIRRDDDMTRWAGSNEQIAVREVSGGHHMHMDGGLGETAGRVAAFFGGGGGPAT
ncbi:MAG: alpha/beta hydrolase [Porticoccaceae bacterium]|nr:alpha/beta hydrolase [Pseudomonadota bacterium]